MTDTPHRRLLAWQIASGLAADAIDLARALPLELTALGLQIDRAARASLDAIIEAASAATEGQRVAALAAARGEVTELEVSLDAYELLGFGPTDALRERAERVNDLLAGLAMRTEAGCAI